MGKSVEQALATANRLIRESTAPLPDSLPEVDGQTFESAIREAADIAGPFDPSVKESLDDSVPRRRALGAAVLLKLFGPANFGELIEHMAGSAIDAFRSGNVVKGKIALENVGMAINRRRGEGKKSEGDPEEQLKDPARRAAGSAAREKVEWAAGDLKIVAGRDIEAKKAKEEKEGDKLAG